MALISEYDFNENNGSSTAADLTGNGYNLSVVGSPFTASGHNGNAARGGTSTNRIEGPVGPNTLFQDWTVMAWVKLDGYTDPYRAVIADGNNFYLEFTSYAGGLRLECYSGTAYWPNGPTGYTTTTGLGVWMHVAVTRSAGTDYFGDGPSKVYVNGVEVASGNGRAYNFANPGFEVGSVGNGAGYNLNGTVDDLRLFDEALTESQIVAWMNTAARAKPPILLAAYAFNESSGATTTADYSGNSITANISGASFTDGALPETRAVMFTGTSQYVSIPRVGTEPASTGVTAMLWGKGPVDMCYLVKPRGGNSTRSGIGPNWRARWKDDLHFTDSGSSVDTNIWHHYCVVDTDTQWVIYIDGLPFDGNDRSLNPNTSGIWEDFPWRIGETAGTGLGDSQPGQMVSDVRIFQGEMTQAAVQSWMNTPVSPPGRKFRIGSVTKPLKLGNVEKFFGS